MASGLLPKSPVSSSLCDEAPHIFIPKSHLEPREFLISSAKRLLQHNLPQADITRPRRQRCPPNLPRLASRLTPYKPLGREFGTFYDIGVEGGHHGFQKTSLLCHRTYRQARK